MRSIPMLILTAGLLPAIEPAAGFWKVWGDGQAEVAAYDLTIPRYGQPRKGVAVTIFVAEPFSKSARVKADPGRHPAGDETPVIKLNLMKDYQTGVYDYHEMLSTFLDTATSRPLKASFTRQEWCGQVYKHLLWDPGSIRATLHSYFDGEADQNLKLDNPGGLSEDAVLLWARGMADPKLKPGESRHTPFLSGLSGKGLPLWSPATASRSVAAGGKEIWSVKAPAGTWTVTVEATGEGRILEWSFPGGERATLIQSARMKYWELNAPGGEAALRKLGVRPRPARTM